MFGVGGGFLTTPLLIFYGIPPTVAAASAQDTGLYRAFFHAMLARGVYLPPSAFESWFVNAALSGEALDRVLEALPAAARAAGVTASGCGVYGGEPEAGDDGKRSLEAGRIVRIETPAMIAMTPKPLPPVVTASCP